MHRDLRCLTLAALAASLCMCVPHTALAQSPGPGTVTLIYSTSWPTTYLHYNPDGAGWNGVPGTAMVCPTNASYPCTGWRELTVAGNSIVFVTTDGTGQWDNNGGRNYDVANSGIYQVENSVIMTLQTFADVCPGSPLQCSGHGTCSNGLCVCATGFYGVACNKSCFCGEHQTCNSQGNCICQAGWSTCDASSPCSVDTSNDTSNCGACGHSCFSNHVDTYSCIAGVCNVTCNDGFLACPTGVCAVECGLPGCQTYQDNQCSGNTIVTDPSFANHTWQTFPQNSSDYRASYQDYAHVQGHARAVYTSPALTAADLVLVPITRDPSAVVTCSFDDGATFSSSCTARFSADNQTTQVYPVIKATSTSHAPATLFLDPVDFIWNHPKIDHTAGDYRTGQKGSIVEMFGWPHKDIQEECAFLSRAGYLGVKFFPVQEQVMSSEPFNNVMNPWYFMYQPVSYRLQGRMGTREELRAAVNYCRSLNVRVYADAVVNHMVGCGNDANPNHRNDNDNYCATWGVKNTSADFPPSFKNQRNGSSPFFSQCFTYLPMEQNNLSPMQEFPAVPYGPLDFHCERALNSWDDPLDLNAGWLTGLVDLNTERENVQQRIADYMTDLLGVGFSGFRIDAAKHIQPPDWAGIFSKLKVNLGGALPADFIVWMEVLTGGEGDMLLCNPDSGYSYSKGLENDLLGAGLTMTEVTQIKIWFDAYPKQPGIDCGQLEMNRKAIQNDDADQQNPGSTSRDMGNQGTVLVIEKDISLHRQFEEQLFTNPNGASDNNNDYPIRMVLSSFWLPEDAQDYGIPDGKSNCDVCLVDCSTCDAAQSMNTTTAYEQGASGYTGNMVGGKYTRVHRDLGIVNAMRGWMGLPNLTQSEHDAMMRV
jgi:alpha-amylase